MGKPRGSSERTRNEILQAARELFAERPIPAVSTREIASAAGVDHALVHRYFGNREELLAEIVRAEVETAAENVSEPAPDAERSLDALRRRLLEYLTEQRQTLLLIARAEHAGLEPAKMLDEDTFRPLGMVAAWIAEQQEEAGVPEAERQDPALVSALVGGAVFSLVTLAPWLMSAVGLDPDDFDGRKEEIVDLLVDMVRRAAGDGSPGGDPTS